MKHQDLISKIQNNGHTIVVSEKDETIRLYVGGAKTPIHLPKSEPVSPETIDSLNYYLNTDISKK